MRKLLFLLLVLTVALSTVMAQERSVAFYGLGGSGFASGGERGSTGLQYGGGISFNSNGRIGFGMEFVTSSFRTEPPVEVEIPSGDDFARSSHQLSRRTRMVIGALEVNAYRSKSRNFRFGIRTGPAYLMNTHRYAWRALYEPPGFQFDVPSFWEETSGQFAGLLGFVVEIYPLQNLALRFGVNYVRPFSGSNKSGLILPLAGGGPAF